MTDRITTTCQHHHTVTLRLDEGEWYAYGGWVHTVRSTSDIIGIPSCDTKADRGGWAFAVTPPPPIRAELEAALAAAEASCGGCVDQGKRCLLTLPVAECYDTSEEGDDE